MPTTMPGISIAEAQKLLQVQDGILKTLPRSRSRARQGGARRHGHRSRAALDAGDGDRAEAAVRVAPNAYLVFVVGARMDAARALRHITADHISETELVAR